MSRIPPGLLYLTIYNPSLRPQSGATSDDDEDAEEQAQIVFYTARERAVSRDRILRQVGLAKALLNFSEMFTPDKGYANVHSQGRRMIMLQPEPDFWIHACLELAKTPRTAPMKSKNGTKEKGKSKLPPTPQEAVYDYHDGSIHDLSLQSHIQRGYDLFKLTHGSFTSILTDLGQHALELQLERFFTVWAWKWDIEEDTDFGFDLGMPLHPQTASLISLLNEFKLAAGMIPFVIAPPKVVPSTSFRDAGYSSCLLEHVIPRLPPPVVAPAPDQNQASEAVTSAGNAAPADKPKGSENTTQSLAQSAFLSMPSMVIPAVDMRSLKWGWPGYLTFGKGNPTKAASPTPRSPLATPDVPSIEEPDAKPSAPPSPEKADEEGKAVEVDAESLREAISTDGVHPYSPAAGSSPALLSIASDSGPTQDEASVTVDAASPVASELGTALDEHADKESSSETYETLVKYREGGDTLKSAADPSSPMRSVEEISSRKESLPPYLPTTVHLREQGDLSGLRRRRVWHLTDGDLTFAVVTEYEVTAEQLPAADEVVALLDRMRNVIAKETQKATTEAAPPSATKILQPQDRHLISAGGFTESSSLPISKTPEHLLNARQITQSSDLDAVEVFSRGQNPQHWHIAKRGFGQEVQAMEGEVFMQIARKESTLTDVDNDLAGVIRSFLER